MRGAMKAADIAARFKDSKRIEKGIAPTSRAFVRFGELAAVDGGSGFVLRQAA